MDDTRLHLTVTTCLAFLVLTRLQASVQAQDPCSASEHVEIPENNEVGHLVATITVQPGVTATLNDPEGPFTLNGIQLLAARVFDAEKEPRFIVRLTCRGGSVTAFSLIIIVLVKNLNDNPPMFQEPVYKFNVSELSPENTVVGRVEAEDLDELPLFYRLDGETHGFKLLSSTVAEILVQTPANYDDVQNVSLTLFVQDTPLTSPDISPSFNASTTVEITILDVDNRPPWLQPCTKYASGNNVICSSSGYTGQVTLNKKEPGILKLNPGPLYAIDGDFGIDEEIRYEILGGNDGNLFEINPSTGNVSMQKEANTLETITLTVLATQKSNIFQATTTSITISVLRESLHPPQFQSPQYQGTVTGVGSMALDLKNEPLQFLATDADYAAEGGINPSIRYYVKDRSDFSIVEGYLFMTKNLPEATLNLQVVARDSSNEETATAELLLEVKSGPVPTTVPSTTAGSVSSTSHSASTHGTTLTPAPSGTTTKPSESTDGTGLTTTPSGTTTKPSEPTDGTGLTTTPSGTTTKPSEPTDGTGLTTTPSGTTTKPSESTDGTGLTTTPSGTATKPSESTGTGLTTTLSGTTSKPSDSTGTSLTTTPSRTTTKPSDSTGTGLTTTPSRTTTKPSDSTGTGLTTTRSGTTSKPSESTDGTGLTTTPFRTTINPSMSTTKSSTEGSGATPEPSQTNGPVPSANTPLTVIVPSGGYGPNDMAALGVTLGVLLFLALVAIGFLIIHIRRDRGDWKKIIETNKFRSSLNNGFGGGKKGIQYTNDAFTNDEDGSSTRSGSPGAGTGLELEQPRKTAQDLEKYLSPKEPSFPVQEDAASQSGSDGDDKEKEVRPILTKGRRQDEGYKSVWFKEDINPEAKEEVVIIPDSRENDSDEEEQEQPGGNREESDRGEKSERKRPKARIVFEDEKPNSGGEDSQDDEVLTINL